ncbi:MAG: response regulator [Peptostreptococcaceae bacterium]|nr:response regulator [Peptostreptococcaceae bacterium]
MIGKIMDDYKLYELNEIERNTLDAINVPIEVYEIVGGELSIIYFNKETLDFFEGTYEKLATEYERYMYSYIHPEDRKRLKETTDYAIENDKSGYECTYRSLNRKTGKYYWINEKANIVKKNDGVVLLYVNYINPSKFEELYAKDEDNILSNKKLGKETDFQKALLSRLSHNMRTPMNAIVNFAEFGITEAENDNTLRYFKDIKTSSEYLSGLLNDMLDLHTIETGKIEIKPDIIEYKNFINSILKIFSVKAENKNIKFAYLENGDIPSYLFTDRLRLNQIIINLLSNAIKYTPEFGKVYFKIEFNKKNENETEMTVKIVDNGIGISKEFMEKLFVPFTRENNKLISAGDGSGLGLSIVKNLIEILGGDINIRSKYGKGTFCTVTLPLIEISKDEYLKKPNSYLGLEDANKLKGKKILIVDDNQINLKILNKILLKVGCMVEIAYNGVEAFEQYKRYEEDYFDAIVMDVKMPLMDGYSCTKMIRNENKKIPIIILSANAYHEDVTLSLLKGANAHLSKPIDKRKLISTLEFFVI